MNIAPHHLARKAAHFASRVFVPRGRAKVVQAKISGFELLVLANEDVGREIVYLGRYEARDSAFLAALIRPDDVCFDVGANTGFYTVLMARRASGGRVHSFEPVAFNWHLLNCNVALNGLANVCVSQCALGDKVGAVEFSQSTDGAYSSLIAVGRRPEERRVEVRIDTLPNYLQRHGIARVDVVKIDVEGAESLVLEGAKAVFENPQFAPRVAMIELFDGNLRAYGSSGAAIMATMRDYGYQAYCASTIDGHAEPFDPQRHQAIYNVFFARDPKHVMAASTAAPSDQGAPA